MFPGFCVFEYALRQKTKSRKCWKSTNSFVNTKAPLVNVDQYLKTDEKLPICYLSTILALMTKKLL